jgi:hypothetical protein
VNRNLQLPVDIDVIRHPGQTVLLLSFRREALGEWCLGLSLLKEGLIDTLTVAEERGKGLVKIQILPKPETRGSARVSFKSNVSQFEITRTSLEYLQRFFLKYYRDGVADVDHIDLEATDVDTGKTGEYIKFRVPDSRPAVSPEEAERRLRG